MLGETVWPSGLRRWLKAPVRKVEPHSCHAVVKVLSRHCLRAKLVTFALASPFAL